MRILWTDSPVRARRAAWLVLAVSTTIYLAVVLVWQPAGFSDVSVYRAEARALYDGRDLYGPLPGVHGLATYPPFAAAAFAPLLLVPDGVAGLISLPVNLALLLAAAYLSLRRVSRPVDLRVAVPLLAAAAPWCEPVMSSNDFGQINLAILCLVLWDLGLPEGSRWRGVGIGVATALKVTPAIFIVYLVVTGRFRAAAGAVGTLIATLAVSAVLAPSSTWGYWTHHVLEPSRVGRLENSVNQSVRGWIVRATHSLEPSAVTTAATVLVAAVGLASAVYVYRHVGDEWGVLVVALTGLLVSPISWSHHWVWCVPLLALAWSESRALFVATLLVFWTHVVRLVPHGDHVELGLDPGQVAMSGWYVVYAAAFVTAAVVVAMKREDARPPLPDRAPVPAYSAGA